MATGREAIAAMTNTPNNSDNAAGGLVHASIIRGRGALAEVSKSLRGFRVTNN